MYWVLVLKQSKEFVTKCEAKSIEEATQFFIQRKQMKEDVFHSMFDVLPDRRNSDK